MKKIALPLLALGLAAAGCQGGTGNQATATDTTTNMSAGAASSNAVANGAAANGAAATAPSDPAGNGELRLIEKGFATGAPGLHAGGSIEFGKPKDEVLAALTAIRGQPTATGRNEDCPSGPVDYASFGPLDVHFEDNRFAGWVLDGQASPRIENEWGYAIGMQRSELGAGDRDAPKFEKTSLGTEFSAEGIGGIMDGDGPNARVATLFSGVTCFAR